MSTLGTWESFGKECDRLLSPEERQRPPRPETCRLPARREQLNSVSATVTGPTTSTAGLPALAHFRTQRSQSPFSSIVATALSTQHRSAARSLTITSGGSR